MSKPYSLYKALLAPAVIVAALGYFVDVYDLVLFSMVRVQGLKDLGYAGEELFHQGVYLLDLQMFGMLVGGVFWGILGDKRGRLSVLFGSIVMYSLANLANAFVTSIDQYAFCRFFAGVGLAGELGAGITLVSEILPKEIRSLGTTLVAGIGVSGALLAAFITEVFPWRHAYVLGGVLGFLLLFLRVKVMESKLFGDVKAQGKALVRGDFFLIFKSWNRFLRFVNCIVIGLPIWFVLGVLMTFAPELARELGHAGEVTAGQAIMYCYIGMIFGDFGSGLLSHTLKNRRKVVLSFLIFHLFCLGFYFFLRPLTSSSFYAICFILGLSIGYWAVLVTMAAEQFGTNLRATVTTSVPNFVRGSTVIITLALKAIQEHSSLTFAGIVVGGICLLLALTSLHFMQETFGKDLDFLEV